MGKKYAEETWTRADIFKHGHSMKMQMENLMDDKRKKTKEYDK